jgi:chromate transporter
MTDLLASRIIEQKPSLKELTLTFAKIGCLSFGGPAGQISLMHRIVVDEKRWLDHERFMSALNYCMLLPGPEAQQLATYIGWLMHGKRGGIITGLLFILPGLLCIFALAFAYALVLDASWLAATLAGLKAAVLAVIIQALMNIGRKALKTPLHIVIAFAAFVALAVFSVPFPLVVLAAGLAGLLFALKAQPIEPQALGIQRPPIRLKSVSALALTGIALWQSPLLLALFPSVPSILSELHIFFSKMAVVTFGGAYAVLTYVAQVAVEQKAWISASAMLDGLAFAEATPGPLVLVLPFISFLAGFSHSEGISPLIIALSAGMISAWATFVPSFLFIFLGAPFVERLNAMPLARAAMSAVTAAVVGVIANLTLWFGVGILFGAGRSVNVSQIDLFSLSVVIASLCLIFIFRRGVMFTLGAGLAFGLIRLFMMA